MLIWENNSDEQPWLITPRLFTSLSCLPTANSMDGTPVNAPTGFTQSTSIYVISVRTVWDVQASVNLARNHDVHLVAKNRGHEFGGKSIGRGPLSVQTCGSDEIDIIDEYTEGGYTCTEPRMQGRQGSVGEEYLCFWRAFEYMVLPRRLYHSLKVVIANGRFITAGKEDHQNLYWEFSGAAEAL
ncbi:hypothetical protein HOY80DRAFT_999014 [Tuber brumale]|nr:hypothetical protein HOY80DRAFT_999014 [Tuber brumale]